VGDRISSLNPRPEANPLQKVVFPEPKSPLSKITEPYSVELERFLPKSNVWLKEVD
jgi:hypothetical protein